MLQYLAFRTTGRARHERTFGSGRFSKKLERGYHLEISIAIPYTAVNLHGTSSAPETILNL